MAKRRGRQLWIRGTFGSVIGLGSTLVLTGTLTTPASALGSGSGYEPYKGIENLDLVSVAPNIGRCGEFPNFEAEFAGEGIDEAGGAFTVVSSACQNIQTGEVFDLNAVDTYVDGSTVNIVATPFTLSFDPDTCASSTTLPVLYFVDGGTGAFAGASGVGLFNFISNDSMCNGELVPAFVAFGGLIQ